MLELPAHLDFGDQGTQLNLNSEFLACFPYRSGLELFTFFDLAARKQEIDVAASMALYECNLLVLNQNHCGSGHGCCRANDFGAEPPAKPVGSSDELAGASHTHTSMSSIRGFSNLYVPQLRCEEAFDLTNDILGVVEPSEVPRSGYAHDPNVRIPRGDGVPGLLHLARDEGVPLTA